MLRNDHRAKLRKAIEEEGYKHLAHSYDGDGSLGRMFLGQLAAVEKVVCEMMAGRHVDELEPPTAETYVGVEEY